MPVFVGGCWFLLDSLVVIRVHLKACRYVPTFVLWPVSISCPLLQPHSLDQKLQLVQNQRADRLIGIYRSNTPDQYFDTVLTCLGSPIPLRGSSILSYLAATGTQYTLTRSASPSSSFLSRYGGSSRPLTHNLTNTSGHSQGNLALAPAGRLVRSYLMDPGADMTCFQSLRVRSFWTQS